MWSEVDKDELMKEHWITHRPARRQQIRPRTLRSR